MRTETLEKTFPGLGLTVVEANDRAVALQNVPAGPGFSKMQTNVVLMRKSGREPFIVLLVDSDLEYRGGNAATMALFESAARRDRWRVVPLPSPIPGAVEAIRATLDLLESDATGAGSEAEQSLLAHYGCRPMAAHKLQGRQQETFMAVPVLIAESSRLLLVAGGPRVGKSSFVAGIAERLGQLGYDLVSINLAALFAGTLSDGSREELLHRVLCEAAGRRRLVLALDQIQLLQALPLSSYLLSSALDRDCRMVGLLPPEGVKWFTEGLPLRTALIELHEMDRQNSLAAAEARVAHLEAHHGIPIDVTCARIAVERSIPMAGVLPDKTIALLDLAAARAVLERAEQVNEVHVLLSASDMEATS